jgi:hypothetical protein
VPDLPGDAVGGAGRAEECDLISQPVGEILDVLDEPGERVTQQFTAAASESAIPRRYLWVMAFLDSYMNQW